MNALLSRLNHYFTASLLSLVVGSSLLSAPSLAQVPDRVGRIAYLAGDVQFYSEGAQAWVPAQLNAPVSSRNSVFAGAGGRAEIRFGSTAVALDSQTQLDIHVLDDAGFKAGVPRGSISVRAGQIESDESFEISAPGASYTVLQASRLRVDVEDNGSSVSVFTGLVNASVAGDGSAMVEAGQALSASGGGYIRSSARGSALDSWATQRDNANRSGQSTRYVSPNMTGYEELDAHGRWTSDPDYGNVWYPTSHVSSGWAPYRDGHWAYVAPWGWTWIDDAPWGFAPFHYGRWVMIGSRWAWMPGAYVRRPSYAPALVGFIGGNVPGSVAMSISIGARPAVGWYPLSPWEHYRPAYTGSANHVRNINNFNMGNPPSHAWRTVEHNNERSRVSVNQMHGATVVPHDSFVGSRSARREALAVTAPELAMPQPGTAPVVAPTRSGMAGRNATLPILRPADALPPSTPANGDAGQRIYRNESRYGERQVQPAVVAPQQRESVPVFRNDGAQQQGSSVPVVNPESRSGSSRGENRGVERQSQPPIVVGPPTSQPVVVPRVDSSPARQWGTPEQAGGTPQRRDGGQRSASPAAVAEPVPQARTQPPQPEIVAPHMRGEAPARTETRMEQRVEPRIIQRVETRSEPRVEQRVEPRIEQRIEQRPDARPAQRAEPPPQVRVPQPQTQPQPEQRRTPEQERERRPHGERGREG